MRILGIETSCDETSAAVVEDGKRLLSVVTATSMDLHAAYGGVVPEIAARSHIESIMPVIEKALSEAHWSQESGVRSQENKTQDPFDPWNHIDGIAVTYGAGLGGSLLVGVMTARTLAITHNKPLYAINHVEGHIYANFLTEVGANLKLRKPNYKTLKTGQKASYNLEPITYNLPQKQPEFPMLGLIVSGGHSQLVLWRDHFDYTLLGQTHDDAIGEAFDKVAKILGLPYPGGPSVGALAKSGDPYAYDFPKARLASASPALEALRAMSNEQRAKISPLSAPHSLLRPAKPGYDFSYSGIKTAVLRAAQAAIGEDHRFPSHQLPERLSEQQKTDIAASFQRVAIETVVDKTVLAVEEFQPRSVVIGGGVAASPELRRQLAARLPHASDLNTQTGTPYPIRYTDPKLCTDNGAMIAALGCFKAMLGQETADPYALEIAPNLSM